MQLVQVIWLVLVSLLLVVEGKSQHGNQSVSNEELETQLSSASGQDRITILHQLSSRLSFQNVSSAREYAEEALDLSKAIRNDSLIAESHYQLGNVLGFTDDKALAISNYLDAQVLFEEAGSVRGQIKIKQVLGSIYSQISEYEKASQAFFKSLELSSEIGNERGEVFALTKLGIVHQNLDEYRIAQRFLHDAIHKAQEIGDWGGESLALSEAGFLEERNGNFEKAGEYFQKAIDLFEEKGYVHAVPQLMFSQARVLKDEARLNEALKVANEAVALADSLGNRFLALNSLDEVAEIYEELGEVEKAAELLERGIKESEEGGFTNSTYFLLNKLAHTYLKTNNLRDSEQAASRGVELALAGKDWTVAENLLEVLIEVHKLQNKFEDATRNHERLLMVRDSILDEERARNILEFEARFRIGEKEKEIATLKLENERKAFIQVSLIGGLVLLVLIALLIVRSQRLKIQRSDAKLELSNIRRKELERDLEFKNKQLTTQSLNMVQKNEMMEEIKQKVDSLKEGGSSRELNSIAQLVDYSASLDKDWKQFQMHFEEVHSGFYHTLKDRYPELTPNEMRLSALVKLNLTIKEMAAILGISPDSVKTARYRLRKKLDLNTEDNLSEFMLQLEKESLEVG
ncbi:MAG: tetratricopeptide repeat protein [Balneola sp.]